MGPNPTWRTRIPFFYGWVVLGSLFLTQGIAFGIYYSFSVFFVALLGDFGWDRAPTAGAFSLFLVVSGLGGIASGALVDRFGPSRLMPAGALLLASGLAATSRITQLWEFYLYFGVVCGLGLSMSGWVPTVAVISRWFVLRRAVTMGVAGAGIGLGIVVMVPLAQHLISSFGWRTTYLFLAGAALFGIAPQAAVLLVGNPGKLGLRPDGMASSAAPPDSRDLARAKRLVIVDQQWASRAWTVSTAACTRRFWLLVGNVFFCSITNQMLWAHHVAYLVDVGYEKLLAAMVAGLAGFLSMPGKILWGMVGDRLGRELTFTLGAGCVISSLAVLVVISAAPYPWLVVLFAIFFATGYAVSAPMMPASGADIFAGRSFGSIYGVISLGLGLGSAFGTWLAGAVFDLTGSYLLAFGIAAASSVCGVTCLWLAAPRKVRRVVWGKP